MPSGSGLDKPLFAGERLLRVCGRLKRCASSARAVHSLRCGDFIKWGNFDARSRKTSSVGGVFKLFSSSERVAQQFDQRGFYRVAWRALALFSSFTGGAPLNLNVLMAPAHGCKYAGMLAAFECPDKRHP